MDNALDREKFYSIMSRIANAMMAGDYATVRRLVMQKFNSCNVINLLVQKDSIPLFRDMIHAGVDLNQGDSQRGRNPLGVASELGLLNIVQFLIENNANVNYTANAGETALLIASRFGHLEIVRFLIDKGANIDHAGGIGITSLMVASGPVSYTHLTLPTKA